MSSSSNNRPSSLVERRIANENAASRPRQPSGQPGGTRTERDPRRPLSPQTSTSGSTHRRAASNSQRTKGGVEERRTERVQVTTRETLTSRTRSPERRQAPPMQQQERTRPSEISRTNSTGHGPRPSRAESSQGTFLCRCTACQFDNHRPSSMDPRSLLNTPYDSPTCIASIYTSACSAGSTIFAACASQ